MATKQTIKRREYQRQRHIEKRHELNERARNWYCEHRDEVAAKTEDRMSDPEYREKRNADARRTYRLRQIKKRREARAIKKSSKNS